MIRRRFASVAASLALASGAVSAESFRNPPARPLLVMTTHARVDYAMNTQIPPDIYLNSLFVFADRTLIQSFNSSASMFDVDPQVSSHARGRVPVAEWNILVSAMTNARVDVHEDCRILPVGLPPFQTVSEIVIRWYGRQGRRNTFTVRHLGDTGPICEFAVIELMSAIINASAKVAGAGTSEYFAVP
jgi:hypothetical protein